MYPENPKGAQIIRSIAWNMMYLTPHQESNSLVRHKCTAFPLGLDDRYSLASSLPWTFYVFRIEVNSYELFISGHGSGSSYRSEESRHSLQAYHQRNSWGKDYGVTFCTLLRIQLRWWYLTYLVSIYMHGQISCIFTIASYLWFT